MDIAFDIRTGNRTVFDNGSVGWLNCKTDRHLVTYLKDKEGAIQEALTVFERILRKQLESNIGKP